VEANYRTTSGRSLLARLQGNRPARCYIEAGHLLKMLTGRGRGPEIAFQDFVSEIGIKRLHSLRNQKKDN
jgi:hypothetical protein